MLDLVEHLFNRYGIRSLRYDGSMSRENRERAIIEFRHAGSPKVILIRSVASVFRYMLSFLTVP